MLDAVQAASFVTEKKTAELVEKVASLGGSHRAELLKENMVCFNTRKHTNEARVFAPKGVRNLSLYSNLFQRPAAALAEHIQREAAVFVRLQHKKVPI